MQLEIPFGVPYARGSHSSFRSAQDLRQSGTRGIKMAKLLEAYRQAGAHGCTNLEAAAITGLPLQSVCSLRASAADCGLLRKAGTRTSVYGKSNDVWVIAKVGEDC